jgi:hypothetical protein
MPVQGWEGFPPDEVELVKSAKELLELVKPQDSFYKVDGQERAEERLERALMDFVINRAVA